jgi:hypothetical protein
MKGVSLLPTQVPTRRLLLEGPWICHDLLSRMGRDGTVRDSNPSAGTADADTALPYPAGHSENI